jgi:hypothetical protein
VLLVGDAVRDANPDTGTGANDAHHGAEAIGEVLKEWHAAALIANETSLTCALQKDAKGGLEAFQASTGPLGSMTTVGLSADKTLEMEYDPKKTPPSICVTRK